MRSSRPGRGQRPNGARLMMGKRSLEAMRSFAGSPKRASAGKAAGRSGR